MKDQWKAFLNKSRLDAAANSLTEIAATLREFLLPDSESVAVGEKLNKTWEPGGPWI